MISSKRERYRIPHRNNIRYVVLTFNAFHETEWINAGVFFSLNFTTGQEQLAQRLWGLFSRFGSWFYLYYELGYHGNSGYHGAYKSCLENQSHVISAMCFWVRSSQYKWLYYGSDIYFPWQHHQTHRFFILPKIFDLLFLSAKRTTTSQQLVCIDLDAIYLALFHLK